MTEMREPYGFVWGFVALEYYALILNRIYLVLIADRLICGAYMGGPVASLPFGAAASDPAYWLSEPHWRKYAGMDVRDPEFTSRHLMNFQHSRADITSVVFNSRPKWGMGAVPYSGRIHISWQGGRKREFILLGQQDGPAIRERLWVSTARASVGAASAVPLPSFRPGMLWPIPGLG